MAADCLCRNHIEILRFQEGRGESAKHPAVKTLVLDVVVAFKDDFLDRQLPALLDIEDDVDRAEIIIDPGGPFDFGIGIPEVAIGLLDFDGGLRKRGLVGKLAES